MRIRINGEWQDRPGIETVAQLLESLSLAPLRVAVERNKMIVRRADFGATELADEDQLEIVTLVGGG